MTYVDTSVVLAHVLAEDRQPPEALWGETLVSSRLTQYEAAVRLNARGMATSHGAMVSDVIARMALMELTTDVLARALEPFPTVVRTLDALHLASIDFLRRQGIDLRLASYDDRMLTAARAMGVPIASL